MTVFVPELLTLREREIHSQLLLLLLFLNLAFTRPYHWGQGGVQAGLRLAVVGITVLVAAAVVDEADLEVHPALQPAGRERRQDDKSRAATDSDRSQKRVGWMRPKVVVWVLLGKVGGPF